MFSSSLPRVTHILVKQCSNKIRSNYSVREMLLLASFDAVVDDVIVMVFPLLLLAFLLFMTMMMALILLQTLTMP